MPASSAWAARGDVVAWRGFARSGAASPTAVGTVAAALKNRVGAADASVFAVAGAATLPMIVWASSMLEKASVMRVV